VIISYMRPYKALFLYIFISALYYLDAFRGTLPLPGDAILEIYPLRALMGGMLEEGALPLWNPYMFIGFPFLSSMQTGVLYPPNLFLSFALSPVSSMLFSLLMHASAAGFFAYLYVRLITGSEWASFASGIAYGFMGFIQSEIFHPPVQYAAAWLPLVLYFLEKLRARPGIENCFFVSLTVAFQIFAGHPQTALLSGMLYCFYVLFFGLKKPKFMLFGAVSLALGIAVASSQVLPGLELSGLSFRGRLSYEIFSQLSYPLHMLPAMIFPFFWGGGYGGAYWGPPATLTVAVGFAGSLTFVLSLLVFIRKTKEPHVLFWGLAASFVFLLALGDGIPFLNRLLYEAPFLSLFRAPSRHMLEVDMSLSALFGIALSFILGGDKRFAKLTVISLFALALGVSAFTFLLSLFGDIPPLSLSKPGQYPGALSPFNVSIFLPVLFLSAYAAAISLSRRQGRISMTLLIGILFFEALSFRSIHKDSWPGLSEIISKEQSPIYRFLAGSKDRAAFIFETQGKDTQDLFPVAGEISMLNGYDPLILKDMSDLLDMEGIGYSHRWEDLIANNLILSMLNTKYIIVPDEKVPVMDGIRGKPVVDGGMVRFAPPIGAGLPPSGGYENLYVKLLEEKGKTLYLNRNSMPRAFSVRTISEAGGLEDIKRRLYTFRMDPREEALLGAGDINLLGRRDFVDAKVTVLDYKPNGVILNVDSAGPAFVVLADQYYPGWNAYVDGKKTRIFKTNGLLRGVPVQGGGHLLSFKYFPLSFYAGLCISILVIAFYIVLIAKFPSS
jgi:hypothetical protein